MPSNGYLLAGKLELGFLSHLLEKYCRIDQRVVVGPKVGVDATVIDFGTTYLIAKTDPITFVTKEVGFYGIVINANDIACMGGRPRWFLATLLLPEGLTTQAIVEDLFAQLSEACQEFGLALCGGHTEVTYGINRPIVVGVMLGEVEKHRLVTSAGVKVGDEIVVTKGIAVEATSIIARERETELAEMYSPELVARCKEFIRKPGISVVKDAELAMSCGEIHAMHDPTEGGIATGLLELARASGVGLRVELDEIPMFPETKLLCDHYGLDALGIIASGALLIACPSKTASKLVKVFEEAGIRASIIGRALPPEEGLHLIVEGEAVELPKYPRDEIVKIF